MIRSDPIYGQILVLFLLELPLVLQHLSRVNYLTNHIVGQTHASASSPVATLSLTTSALRFPRRRGYAQSRPN